MESGGPSGTLYAFMRSSGSTLGPSSESWFCRSVRTVSSMLRSRRQEENWSEPKKQRIINFIKHNIYSLKVRKLILLIRTENMGLFSSRSSQSSYQNSRRSPRESNPLIGMLMAVIGSCLRSDHRPDLPSCNSL